MTDVRIGQIWIAIQSLNRHNNKILCILKYWEPPWWSSRFDFISMKISINLRFARNPGHPPPLFSPLGQLRVDPTEECFAPRASSTHNYGCGAGQIRSSPVLLSGNTELGAGGKPSTWLPPGITRRAPTIMITGEKPQGIVKFLWCIQNIPKAGWK